MPEPLRIVLIVLAVLYILSVPAPAISMFLACFRRMSPKPYEERDFTGTYVEPYEDQFYAALPFFKKLEPEEWTLASSQDGVKLAADYYGQDSKDLIIMVHGYNAAPYNNLVVPGKDYYEKGYDLLFLYQRGHLKSRGKSAMGLKERYDLLDWIALAAEKFPEKNIILWGISMGGATVAYTVGLVREPRVKAAVIDCGFISPRKQLEVEAKKNHVPGWIVIPRMALLCRIFHKIDLKETTEASLKADKLPTLFLHGTADTVVLPEHGETNFESCGSSTKRMILKEGAGHGMAYPACSAEERDEIEAFLKTEIEK